MSFPTGWTKKCSLTINASQVSDADSANLSNFPVLLTEANFPSTIFDNTQSAGQDLRFTSDEAGTTELAFEIVNWDTTNDKAEVWVKVPTVDYDDDTVFYVWYGNATATAYAPTDTYGTHAVWADYEGVWHLTNANDSSANGYNLTASSSAPTSTSGLIGSTTTGAYDFERGSSQFLKIANASCPNLEISGNLTYSCWIKKESSSNGGTFGAMTKRSSWPNNVVQLAPAANDYLYFICAGLSDRDAISTQSTGVGASNYIFGIRDKDNSTLKCGIANVETISDSSTGDINDTNGDFTIGANSGGTSEFFDGIIDESRVRASALTAGWIATEYNNQSAPSTFVTEGTETDVGSTGISASKRSINC